MSKELKTGIISILIIVLGIWGFNFLKGQNILNATSKKYYIEYENIQGLNEASKVLLNGYSVGRISDISIINNPEKKGNLLVEVTMNEKVDFSKNTVAEIVSAGLMGGVDLSISPSYEGELAQSGDYLRGIVKPDMLASIGSILDPLESKLSSVLISADSMLVGINQILNDKSRKSLNRSISGLEGTIYDLRKTLKSVNGLVEDNGENLKVTLSNAKKITDDFSVLSKDLAEAELGKTIKNFETTLAEVNTLLNNVSNGKGTLGKLMSDEKLYTNLDKATKELEELLREVKLNPKRFLHFSLFGKKAKPYNEENNNNNVSNK